MTDKIKHRKANKVMTRDRQRAEVIDEMFDDSKHANDARRYADKDDNITARIAEGGSEN